MRCSHLVLFASFLCAGTANAQNLVVNGSFEEPALRSDTTAPETFRLTKIPGWTVKNAAGVEVDGELQRSLVSGSEGRQYLELDASGNTTIYQDIPTVTGQRYVLRYRDAHRGQGSSRIGVLINGTEIGHTIPTDASFRRVAAEFVAAGTVTRIGLSATGTSDGIGDVIDDVAVYAVDASGTQAGYNYYFPYAAEGQGWQTTLLMTPASIDAFSYTVTEYGSDGKTIRSSSDSAAVSGIGTFVTPTGNTGAFQAGWLHVQTDAPANIVQYFRLQTAGISDSESTVTPRALVKRTVGVFDNRAGLNSGLAVANPGTSAITLDITVRNSAGAAITVDRVGIPAKGNFAFVLKERYGTTTNIHGSIEIQATDTATSAVAPFVAMGSRFSATGGYTVIPY